MRLRSYITVIPSVLNFYNRMEKERPPDPGNWDLDTSSQEDKINAYDVVASSYQAGIQPAIFLTHSFLQDHPILLEEGYLTVNWDRIPGLYTRTDKLLMVSITDAQWEKWGQPGGWMAWEPDTQASNFIPNMAVVVCKGVFHDAPDPKQLDKVGHFMTIARVPDCVKLLPFDQLCEVFNSYNEVATTVGLIRLHCSNVVFPDVYFQFYSEHFTIMGLLDPEIRFGTADEFVGGYLVHRHVASSGRKAQAMLPPSYVQGAKCPRPSPTYTYRPGGTGTPGQHPPIHVTFMAAIGRVLLSPSWFCMVEAPAKEWSFNDAPVPWILPVGYRSPYETVPDFRMMTMKLEALLFRSRVRALDRCLCRGHGLLTVRKKKTTDLRRLMTGRGNRATGWLFRFQQRRWQSRKVPSSWETLMFEYRKRMITK